MNSNLLLGSGMGFGASPSNLNAANILTGTLPDARLSATFPRTVTGVGDTQANYGYVYWTTSNTTTTRTFTDPATELSNGWYAVVSTRSPVVIGGVTYPPQASPIIRQYDMASEIWRTYAVVVNPPATATSSGIAGQVAFDGSYAYHCTAANTWRRVSHASW